MLNKSEKLILKGYLKPKKKEGILKIISAFSFLGICLGVATLIIVMSVMNGFRDELISKLLSFQPHITVENIRKNKEDYNKILNILEKNDVKYSSISLIQNGSGLILKGNLSQGVIFKGYDNEFGNLQKVLKQKNLGEIKFSNDEIAIGIDLANKLNLNKNDSIILLSSKTETSPIGTLPQSYKYKIIFLFETGLYEFDSNYVIGNLDQSNKFSKLDNKEIEIRLKNINKSKEVSRLLKNNFNDKQIYHWTDNNKTFYDALRVERNVMFIILTLIIIVATFNIISGLTILVKNKSKEIAILKALGFSNFSISKIFLITGSSIGILGTGFGVFLGVLVSYYIENIRLFLSDVLNIEIFPAEIYFLSKMPTNLDFKTILLISIFSILISVIASLIPALKASKVDPIINLKYE